VVAVKSQSAESGARGTRGAPAYTPAYAPAYPSLHEHRATRRRFLGLAGATVAGAAVTGAAVAAGGVAVSGLGGCSRPVGVGEEPEPDASIELAGAEPEPQYYTVRFPAQGSGQQELSAWLVDGGYVTFWVSAMTWNQVSYQSLLDRRTDAEDRLRTAIADFTYERLSAPDGVAAAEDDLLETLDRLCQEDDGHTNPTIETVTLTITHLSPPEDIGGDMPQPDYP
jgi:hypothetical protein